MGMRWWGFDGGMERMGVGWGSKVTALPPHCSTRKDMGMQAYMRRSCGGFVHAVIS